MIRKPIFVLEGIKITTFCIISAAVFTFLGLDHHSLLILFNMSVMFTVATFSPSKKPLSLLIEGAGVIIVSTLVGGIISFYLPELSGLITICYGTLAFLIPRFKNQSNIFIIGALVFSISVAFPFDLYKASILALCSIILIIIFLLTYWIFDKHIIYRSRTYYKKVYNSQRYTLSLICFSSLVIATFITSYLKHFNEVGHLYWINITILAILQSSSEGMIRKTAITRIVVNAIGAFIIIFLMSFIMPDIFWINFIFLSLLLFGIFAIGYSFSTRTLLIEMFVLSLTHLLGQYHHILSIDRILLTMIGGSLVIITGFIVTRFTKNNDKETIEHQTFSV
ncbi:FUSC family protein [Pseudofrancisella aestuarii]|uniref:FUSC family protein n=1 Tax=Pseudofrancisella aestuarii TaxID=2670347 RepID=A0ABV9TAI0_9GAMM|nr:FUSC family protein [Pseudofrancisella aestuarii]